MHPNYFIIHTSAVRPFIKSEGIITGNRFVLTGWRRDGMLARLRIQGFTVRTLDDEIDALPDLPRVQLPSETCAYVMSRKERYSFFDPQQRDWAAIEPADDEPPVLLLRENWIIRRRRGRGAPDYARVHCERGRSSLISLDDAAALLEGYAQAAQLDHPALHATFQGDTCSLPHVELPSLHRSLMQRIGTPAPDTGWQVDRRGWPLARRLYAALGIELID
jgi:hypothetical protein